MTEILAKWDGEVFVPQRGHLRQCTQDLTAGDIYQLDVNKQRSKRSHRHYFACVNEAWKNLPEHLAKKFPTAEHLRHWALIKCDYYATIAIPCVSAKAAVQVIPKIKAQQPFWVVIPEGQVIKVLIAESQKEVAMSAERFQRSKDDVLNYLASLIQVSRADLEQNTKTAA